MADRTAESAKTGNSEAIAAAFADGPAYIPYLAVGDPDYESSKAYVEARSTAAARTSSNSDSRFSEPIAEGRPFRGRWSARSTPG